jgi:Rrf2 family transcriptional regulator, cysteine metabolism repressor
MSLERISTEIVRLTQMTFTTKEDYGLRAVLDLAANNSSGPVQAREIAARQQIPEQFLEQILAALRRAEIIRSTRGANGGYALAVPAAQLTVGAVLRGLSGPLVPTELIEGSLGDAPSLTEIPEVGVIRDLWSKLREALRSVADQTTLADLLEQRRASRDSFLGMNI